MKKLNEILEKRKLKIVNTDFLVKNPYIVCTITDSKGNVGMGISKSGRMDPFNENTGKAVSKAKAEGALYYSLRRRPLHDAMMGYPMPILGSKEADALLAKAKREAEKIAAKKGAVKK